MSLIESGSLYIFLDDILILRLLDLASEHVFFLFLGDRVRVGLLGVNSLFDF